uniref:Uncharacterized protein n=1 Tax=Manihot esculenta TaxID=3983 RepID=A0A2C9VA36_MANES
MFLKFQVVKETVEGCYKKKFISRIRFIYRESIQGIK